MNIHPNPHWTATGLFLLWSFGAAHLHLCPVRVPLPLLIILLVSQTVEEEERDGRIGSIYPATFNRGILHFPIRNIPQISATDFARPLQQDFHLQKKIFIPSIISSFYPNFNAKPPSSS
jgi:hypothetical protein